MRVVIQRVKKASITIGDDQIASIGKGLLLLVGIEKGDGDVEIAKLAKKVLGARLFDNEAGVLWEKSVKDVQGEVLCVSQFTLMATLDKGTKPNFRPALGPTEAKPIYEAFVTKVRAEYNTEKVSQGIFGSTCDVMLVNDGPTTILYDTTVPTSSAASTPASTKPSTPAP